MSSFSTILFKELGEGGRLIAWYMIYISDAVSVEQGAYQTLTPGTHGSVIRVGQCPEGCLASPLSLNAMTLTQILAIYSNIVKYPKGPKTTFQRDVTFLDYNFLDSRQSFVFVPLGEPSAL